MGKTDGIEIIIPDGVREINNLEYSGLNAVERITVPDTVKIIGNYAFMNCYSLREIRMPAMVEHIGTGIFQNCWQLRSVIIPEGVTVIGSDMFENCHELAELTLPASLEKAEKTAFSRCRSLKKIHVDPAQIELLPASARYTAALTFMEEHAGTDAERSVDDAEAFSIIDSYVSERQNSLLDLAVNRRSTDAVRYLLDHNLVTPESLNDHLRKSAEGGRVEITAMLLDRIGELCKTEGAAEGRGMTEDPFL